MTYDEVKSRVIHNRDGDAYLEDKAQELEALYQRVVSIREEPMSINAMIARTKRGLAVMRSKHLKPVSPANAGPGRIPSEATAARRRQMMKVVAL